ncbi:Hypothetical predicted protein [Cloeon dipterum]|uniref:Ig-like domain-containing protein n=1 Tax=Cloeon dipterum TaxID=197152 RepID=A0A8S1C361_9INSE|nr:Hypothetical predicted protein [Cloeon dipterum]
MALISNVSRVSHVISPKRSKGGVLMVYAPDDEEAGGEESISIHDFIKAELNRPLRICKPTLKEVPPKPPTQLATETVGIHNESTNSNQTQLKSTTIKGPSNVCEKTSLPSSSLLKVNIAKQSVKDVCDVQRISANPCIATSLCRPSPGAQQPKTILLSCPPLSSIAGNETKSVTASLLKNPQTRGKESPSVCSLKKDIVPLLSHSASENAMVSTGVSKIKPPELRYDASEQSCPALLWTRPPERSGSPKPISSVAGNHCKTALTGGSINQTASTVPSLPMEDNTRPTCNENANVNSNHPASEVEKTQLPQIPRGAEGMRPGATGTSENLNGNTPASVQSQPTDFSLLTEDNVNVKASELPETYFDDLFDIMDLKGRNDIKKERNNLNAVSEDIQSNEDICKSNRQNPPTKEADSLQPSLTKPPAQEKHPEVLTAKEIATNPLAKEDQMLKEPNSALENTTVLGGAKTSCTSLERINALEALLESLNSANSPKKHFLLKKSDGVIKALQEDHPISSKAEESPKVEKLKPARQNDSNEGGKEKTKDKIISKESSAHNVTETAGDKNSGKQSRVKTTKTDFKSLKEKHGSATEQVEAPKSSRTVRTDGKNKKSKKDLEAEACPSTNYGEEKSEGKLEAASKKTDKAGKIINKNEEKPSSNAGQPPTGDKQPERTQSKIRPSKRQLEGHESAEASPSLDVQTNIEACTANVSKRKKMETHDCSACCSTNKSPSKSSRPPSAKMKTTNEEKEDKNAKNQELVELETRPVTHKVGEVQSSKTESTEETSAKSARRGPKPKNKEVNKDAKETPSKAEKRNSASGEKKSQSLTMKKRSLRLKRKERKQLLADQVESFPVERALRSNSTKLPSLLADPPSKQPQKFKTTRKSSKTRSILPKKLLDEAAIPIDAKNNESVGPYRQEATPKTSCTIGTQTEFVTEIPQVVDVALKKTFKSISTQTITTSEATTETSRTVADFPEDTENTNIPEMTVDCQNQAPSALGEKLSDQVETTKEGDEAVKTHEMPSSSKTAHCDKNSDNQASKTGTSSATNDTKSKKPEGLRETGRGAKKRSSPKAASTCEESQLKKPRKDDLDVVAVMCKSIGKKTSNATRNKTSRTEETILISSDDESSNRDVEQTQIGTAEDVQIVAVNPSTVTILSDDDSSSNEKEQTQKGGDDPKTLQSQKDVEMNSGEENPNTHTGNLDCSLGMTDGRTTSKHAEQTPKAAACSETNTVVSLQVTVTVTPNEVTSNVQSTPENIDHSEGEYNLNSRTNKESSDFVSTSDPSNEKTKTHEREIESCAGAKVLDCELQMNSKAAEKQVKCERNPDQKKSDEKVNAQIATKSTIGGEIKKKKQNDAAKNWGHQLETEKSDDSTNSVEAPNSTEATKPTSDKICSSAVKITINTNVGNEAGEVQATRGCGSTTNITPNKGIINTEPRNGERKYKISAGGSKKKKLGASNSTQSKTVGRDIKINAPSSAESTSTISAINACELPVIANDCRKPNLTINAKDTIEKNCRSQMQDSKPDPAANSAMVQEKSTTPISTSEYNNAHAISNSSIYDHTLPANPNLKYCIQVRSVLTKWIGGPRSTMWRSPLLAASLLLLVAAPTAFGADDGSMGPVFMREPPNRVDFSNTTGAQVECSARGSPAPEIIWVRADGTAVGDVPGLRQVMPNGNLVFPPFRAEDYRQEVHAQVYVCLARNSVGSIHSRDVHVRAVVQQEYDTDVNKEYVIRGNSGVLKCQVPSFVADFVHVVSWQTDKGETFVIDQNYVVQQFYQSEVNNEYVIRGNSAVLKCSIPSFVADFVSVVSWQDDTGNTFHASGEQHVVTQYYEAEVVSEYVIRGNTAVLKCTIPSFVADFVRVEAWVGSDKSVYTPTSDYVVNQFYEAEIMTEYVIRGNTALLKCSIPSFVADFVQVESWVDDDGKIFVPSEQYVVTQYYVTEGENEYVIRGNSAVMKCKIPSFVSDFVSVEAWISDTGETYTAANSHHVVSQAYESEADNEYVIRGNSAIMKCEVPSFVADFVSVDLWTDSDGNNYHPSNEYVVHQFYQTRVIDEFVLKGNTATLKCLVPSFVSDFVEVVEWLTDDQSHSLATNVNAVNQYYEAQVYDVFVIKGNAAVFKCNIPSFVSDYVEIVSWTDTEGTQYPMASSYVVTQHYQVNVMDEHVLKGNTAIIKCHIPSFVADYVFVSSWVEDENRDILPSTDYDGKYLVLPSGELHIRDVGPEDGYKSYQCRTKHRLTGETRLSATKGRLVITEPIGAKAPKYFTDDRTHSFTRDGGSSFALLCQAQGYPVPAFRWYKFAEGTAKKVAVSLNDRVKQVSGTLIIKEAKVEDSGKYLCVVNNSVGGESVETVLTVTAPLSATVEPETQTVDFGRPAVFTCNFEGNPVKTIGWLKDGKNLNHEDATLRIDSVKKEDKGMYQCFVRNDQESAQASAELKLGGRFEPPQFRHTFGEETLQPGPSVFLKCVASGNPTPEITWELDGKKLTNNDRLQVGQYVTVNGDVVSHLNVSSIITNDGGLYKCIASSKVGFTEHAARVNVYGLPFIRPMEKKAIVAGENLFVTCPVAGYPIENIVWERDGRVLPINRKQKVFPNGTLIIENVERQSDQATYTCVARNSQGYSARGTLEVQVMVPPEILPFTLGERPRSAGQSFSVHCSVVEGSPPVRVRWTLNDQPLVSVRHMKVMSLGDSGSVLAVERLDTEHVGFLTCIAENHVGSAEHSAFLNVSGKQQQRHTRHT